MEKIKQGYYKVNEYGNSYVTATFFNPITKDHYKVTIYDYDDDRVRIFAGEHYDAQINQDARKAWLHFIGAIQIGDLVKIVKGRKFKGEVKKVVKEFTYKIDGMYGRCYGDVEYLVFDDGTKVARNNCELVQNYEALFEEITGKTRQSYLEEYFNDKEEN